MTAESADEESNAKLSGCSHCSKKFKYNSERIRHELSHVPRFECDICCKKFTYISALRRHHKLHKRTELASVKCEECNKKFRDEPLLERHMKYAHNGTFPCTKCSTTFSSELALSTHMMSHKPKSERRFKCSFNGCRKSFNFSHHLKHHELTHTNVKQYYCSECGKGFIQSHNLKTHMKTHDPPEWLYCEFANCKKKTSTKYAMKRHMKIHKVKPDSGISSDGSSCDASMFSKEYAEDFILCATCGENVPQTDYSTHSLKCDDILDNYPKIELGSVCTIKQEHFLEQAMPTTKRMFDRDVGDCKSALGDCIMGAKNCLCAQMSKPIDENYDFTPIGNIEDSVTSENNKKNGFIENYSEAYDFNENETVLKNDALIGESSARNTLETYSFLNRPKSRSSTCERCDCASTCNIREPSNCNININKDNVPNLEYRVDGVIKIKDTFDMDILLKVEHDTIIKGPQKFVPFSTCRDAIGNCIVGGKEGCLCAGMMMDEHQEMAQEIDDITPKRKTETCT